MRYRTTVVGMIQNTGGKHLICKMPEDRGVFPGQWCIPGGGIDPEETMEEALRREIWEEVGLELTAFEPWYFRDDVQRKIKPGRGPEEVYMIYLMFLCQAGDHQVKLNEELEEYAWVSLEEGLGYDLNEATRLTFEKRIREVTRKR